jgi:TonB family protein
MTTSPQFLESPETAKRHVVSSPFVGGWANVVVDNSQKHIISEQLSARLILSAPGSMDFPFYGFNPHFTGFRGFTHFANQDTLPMRQTQADSLPRWYPVRSSSPKQSGGPPSLDDPSGGELQRIILCLATFLRTKEALVFSQSKRRRVAIELTALLMVVLASNCWLAFGQQPTITRKAKTKVAPSYPETARRMNLGGTVKLILVVGANGTVKSTTVLGGHPLLVAAAQYAVKSWTFEPGPEESSGVIELTFKPEN